MRSSLFVLLYLASGTVFSQDACLDPFVQCVQSTGDSFTCRSVYTNCLANEGTDLVESQENSSSSSFELLFKPEIVELIGGLSSVKLSVSNPSSQPIKLGTLTYPVHCADGSKDRVVFSMDGLVQPGVENRHIGDSQVACLGTGGISFVESSSPELEGLSSTSSVLKYEFPCGETQSDWITLKYLYDEKVFRWENSRKILGVLNKEFIHESEFVEMACDASPSSESSDVRKAVEEISRWLEAPGSGTQVIYRTTTTGVRN